MPGVSKCLTRAGDCVLAMCRHAPYFALAVLSARQVFAESLVVLAYGGTATFAVLQSRVHETWARLVGSSIKDDLRYNPSDCFETFPLPVALESSSGLEEAGRRYYEFRAQLMQAQNKGLTAIYNWFHDPDCDCPEIPTLRKIHDEMDRAVLEAYGWPDLQSRCEFIPEFEDDEDEDENGRIRRRKYRYRWPDDVRDEVLARLLELNRLQALEEGQLLPEVPVFADAADPEPKRANGRKKRGKRSGETLNLSLLPHEKEES
jgi:hypothetical protein